METENQNAALVIQPSPDLGNILSRLETMRAQSHSRLLTNRRRIHRALKRLSATQVVVSYSGSGDSGQIDSVTILNGDEPFKPLKNVRVLVSTSQFDRAANAWIESTKNKCVPIQEAIESLVYDWIESEYAGWENNDGASGDCTIDVEEDSFRLEHTWYFTESETMEHSL